ncbi:MAG TPA: NAD(P)/FAD-dependent oxidoreductase [Pirellulales bacterium]|jgi:all-trans-retinol 13,14-reductase|nr:NAD(P)/FAD-dependent oxidoreductase [Pirellulales bacterium]
MNPASSNPPESGSSEKVGHPYRSWDGSGQFDVIVIGSGIGALATAALLAKRAGRRVLVLERHYVAGGYTHVFKRTGYEWDVGLHYVGQFHQAGSQLGQLLADVTDHQLAWAPMGDVYDRILIGGQAYDFVAGRDRFRQTLRQSFPAESSAIDKYLYRVESCVRASRLFFAEKALPPLLALLAGPLLRASFLRGARVTTAQMLEGLTRNRQLIGVLTGQWGDYGLPPAQSSFAIHATIVDHYLEGAAYPVGGASRIAAAIVPVIERAGGRVLLNAEVAQIVVEGRRAVGVAMADGRVIRAPAVVSGIGVANTFDRLLPPLVAERYRLPAKLRAVEPSLAHVNLYVGLRHSDQELGLTTTNLWVHPGPDHDRNLAAYLADSAGPLPYVYISFPSAKDPTFAQRYPGRATLQLIAPARYDWFLPWQDAPWKRRGESYETLKQTFVDRLLAVLYEHVPSVRGKVDHAELSTPLSTRHFTGHAQGEPYGLAHTPARFALRFLQPRTPIRHLYLTGQDVAVCGIAGGLVSGVLTASSMLGRNLFK